MFLFVVFSGCIEGYEFLCKVGVFYRDIFINNFVINEYMNNFFRFLFLIDLDFVIKEDWEGVLGVKGKIGIRVFMVIGVFLGE